ncbi:MAG: hypothetical protein ABIH89_10695 [Elusimicrobiota bacterium]
MNDGIKYIFMLGRPGCGKSYLYNNVFVPSLGRIGIKEIDRIDDFPILKELLDRDSGFRRHVRKDGGFQVTDWTIIDDVLKEMDIRLVENYIEGEVIVAEFARSDYACALKNFTDQVKEESLLVYIWAPFETCIKSNRERYDENGKPDNHIVPEDLMNTYYRTDDIEKLFLEGDKAPMSEFKGWKMMIFDNSDRQMSPEEKQEKFGRALEGYRL